jgi:anti-sigma regulatory factor (Ser/Thr protein kinase)/ketosteroid isomerase-like protein
MERRRGLVPAQSGEGSGPSAPLVLGLLEAYVRGDEDAVLAALHPDVEFVPMLVATGARREPYRGHGGFLEYLRDSRAVMLDVAIAVRAVQEDQDVVVVLAEVTGSAAGGPVEAAVTYVFRIRDGLVVHGIVGSDPDRARRAFGLDTAPAPIEPGETPDELAPLELRLLAERQSVPTVRRAVDAYVGAAGADPEYRHDICLAISEACTNAIVHAYVDRPGEEGSGPLDVTARKREDRIVISVEDEGRGMIARLDSPGLGLGLVLMSRLAARCTITTPPERPRGCRIELEFLLRSEAGSRAANG